MALTDAQMTDVRRHAGYPLAGTSMVITDDQDVVYMRFGMVVMSLHKRLTTLSASEESVLINSYLTPIATLETDLVQASDSLDTAEAGPWKANPQQLKDRAALLDGWRRRMCAFIGIAPGPGLGGGNTINLVRA